MSQIPVSAVVSSDGVVVVVFKIRLIMLSSIFCSAPSSAFVGENRQKSSTRAISLSPGAS